jgi:hypothetical protein
MIGDVVGGTCRQHEGDEKRVQNSVRKTRVKMPSRKTRCRCFHDIKMSQRNTI